MVFYCHVFQLGEPKRSCGIIVPFYTRLSHVTRMIFVALPRSFRQPQVASVGGNIPLKCGKYLQINHCPEWVGLHPLDAGEIHGKISDGQTESLTKGQTKDWMIIHSIVVLWTEWSLTTICCWLLLHLLSRTSVLLMCICSRIYNYYSLNQHNRRSLCFRVLNSSVCCTRLESNII